MYLLSLFYYLFCFFVFSVQCIQVMTGKNDKELLEAMCHLLTYVSDVVAALKVRKNNTKVSINFDSVNESLNEQYNVIKKIFFIRYTFTTQVCIR